MFKKLLAHHITNCDKRFFCHLCMSEQSNLEDALYHITEEKHQLLQADQTVNILKDCEEQTFQALVDNKVTVIALSYFSCISCQRSFADLFSVLQHIQSISHIQKLKNTHVDLNIVKDKSETCTATIKSKLSKVRKKKLDSSDKSVLFKDKYIYEHEKYDSYVSEGHNESLVFFRTLYNYSNKDCKTLVDNSILKVNYYQLMCQYCYRCCLTPDDILQHIMATKHTETNTRLNEQEIKQIQHIPVNSEATKNVMKANLHTVKQMDESKTVNSLQYISVKVLQEENINNDEYLLYDLICELCKCHLPSPDHILPHIKGKKHVNFLTEINKSPQSTEQCGNDSQKLGIMETKSISETVVMDIISEKSETKDYQADLKRYNIDCKISTTSLYVNNCLNQYDQTFLNNKIAIEGSKFICTLCKREIDTLHNILQHINGKSHTNNLKCQDKGSDVCETEYTMCTNNKISDNDDNANQKPNINISNNKMNVSVNKKYGLNGTIHNTIYSANPLLNTTLKEECSINNEDKIKTNEIQHNSNNITACNKYLYFCELCNTQIDIKNLHEHIDTVFHKCNIHLVNMGDDIFLFKCFCCKSIIQGTISLINHFDSTKHLNNLTNTLKHITTTNTEICTPLSTDTGNILGDTSFTLCSVLIPKIENVPMHLSEKCLISFNTSNIIDCDNIKNKIIYFCSICRILLNTTHNLIQHCRGQMHTCRIRQFSKETIINIPKHHCNSEMGKEPIITTTDNCFDITNDINTQIMEALHVSPFRSKLKKRNYKEQRVSKRLNKVYSEKYLEIEEKMYALSKEKLNDIELNCKPLMPCKQNGFYCLVCNVIVSKELNLLYEHVRLDIHKFNVNTSKKDESSEKLVEQYMQKTLNDFIRCHVCKTFIKNDTDRIDAHINNRLHKKQHEKFREAMDIVFNSITQNLSNLWYNIQRFSCVLCAISFNYKMEFIEHIIVKHNPLSKNQQFDFCIPCATLWLDQVDCYTKHCNDVVHKYLIKSKDFMIDDLPECIQKSLEQADKISDILFQETQILMNDSIQKEIVQSLENTLKSFCPSIKAFLFGSRITGLGSASSDIDIYLDCGTYYENQEENLRKKNFRSIEKILHEQKEEWKVKDVLEDSRTPIIKLLYKPTGVQCDISVTNGLSVENSKLIRSFNDAYPPCRKLILFVKKWLSCINLPSRHGITSYAIAWLVIFYLQEKSHLPSVAKLIKQNNKSRLICGWETGVAQPQKNNKPVQAFRTLLLHFFQFYANFDYRYHVICPLMGYNLAKKDFINLNVLPAQMKPYINHIESSVDPEYFRIDSPLCVQDPFDLSHNLTKAVSSITLQYFKQYCQGSASILSSATK